MKAAFAIVLDPSEAGDLVPDWPSDAWAVLTRDVNGAGRWDACPEGDVQSASRGLTAWPPVRFDEAEAIGAEDELSLLAAFRGSAKSATAAARLSPDLPIAVSVAASDIVWDENT